MEVKATVKHIRMSPRKVRLVADVVRGKNTQAALNQLTFLNKKASLPIKKLIESAIANAANNYSLKEDNLLVKEIRVDEGKTLKRWMPRARGRATTIRKRTSHIYLTLGEIVDSGIVESKKEKLDAPIKLDKKAKEDEGVEVKKEDKDDKPQESVGKKKIVDPRGEGRGKHAKIEGKGLGGKFFRRKSG